METLARPVRSLARLPLSAACVSLICFLSSLCTSSIMLTRNSSGALGALLRAHEGADGLAGDGAANVALLGEVEHQDGQVVVLAQRDGGRVHDLEVLLQDLEVGEVGEALGVLVDH